MSHYILVHGAWEGAWSWENTTPELEKQGHRVTGIDLPGSVGNQQAIPEITMEGYVKTVVDVITALDHKVVLVGHSMAGAIISQVAERMPEKIERLVYVAAFLLKNGDSVLEAMQRDPDGEYLPALVFAEDQSYAMAPEAAGVSSKGGLCQSVFKTHRRMPAACGLAPASSSTPRSTASSYCRSAVRLPSSASR